MKIGIITFHSCNNYGAVLQAYALLSALRGLGHDPFIVDYRGESRKDPFHRFFIARSLPQLLEKWMNHYKKEKFDKFRNRVLNLSEETFYGRQALFETPPVSDAFICGSDQIWNPKFLRKKSGLNDAYLLAFPNLRIRKVAYAASMCCEHLDDMEAAFFRRHLADFHRISVREPGSVDALSESGIDNVQCMPDPSLLIDVGRMFKEKQKRSAEGLFAYLLPTCTPGVKVAFQCLKSLVGRKVTLPFTAVKPWYGVPTILDPGEWVEGIGDSAFVLTNSFHGTVFSILQHKPFVVLPVAGELHDMNERIESLLSNLGLSSRIISGFSQKSLESIIKEDIDWKSVDCCLAHVRERGIAFLEEAFS